MTSSESQPSPGPTPEPSPPPAPFAAPDAGYASQPYPPDGGQQSYPAAGGYPPPPDQPYRPASYDPASATPPAAPYGAYQPPPPYAAYPHAPGYAGYGSQVGGYYQPQKTNGLSIGSLVTSIVALPLLSCYGVGIIAGIVGAILGHVARRQIRQRNETGAGMALAGIIVGWIATALGLLVVVGLIGLFSYIASHPEEFASPTYSLIQVLAS